jgi:hypothetical protein
MKSLQKFADIDDKMLWKNAALSQLENFKSLAADIGSKPIVVRSHRSKSIELPVVALSLPDEEIIFVLRDNFYCLNVWVKSDNHSINLPLGELFASRGMNWYKDEIVRKRTYTYQSWSDEEMDDARILRVKVENVRGGSYWSEVSAKAKDRWQNRMKSTAWWENDWSGGLLITDPMPMNDQEFEENTQFFHSGNCYAEGMDVLWKTRPPHYSVGSDNFLIETGNWENTVRIVSLIVRHIQSAMQILEKTSR